MATDKEERIADGRRIRLLAGRDGDFSPLYSVISGKLKFTGSPTNQRRYRRAQRRL